MHLFGVYYQEDKNLYELVFVGDYNKFRNENNLKLLEAFAIDKKTLDYDKKSFIVEVSNSTKLVFDEKVESHKNFEYTKLLKINKKIKINIVDNVVEVKVK